MASAATEHDRLDEAALQKMPRARKIVLTGWTLSIGWTLLLAASFSLYYRLNNLQVLKAAAYTHALVWVLGVWLIGLGSRKLVRTISALQESEESLRKQALRLEMEVQERHLSEEARRESERFLSTIVDTEPECVKLLARDGTLLMMNPAGLAMIEADSLDQVKGECVYSLVAPEHRELFSAKTEEVFQGRSVTFEFEAIGLKGGRLWLESRCVPFRNAQGHIESTLCITRDITERRKHEETLRELSLADELTGLTNRRGFMLLAAQQMKLADRNQNRLALIFADLDRLKTINDTFGHAEGDRAILDTAIILKNSFRASDIVARVGGDEFVALSVETSPDIEEAIRSRLCENLHAHNLDRKRPYPLSLSCGITIYDPAHPVLLEELIEQGDRLMYEQKRVNQTLSSAGLPDPELLAHPGSVAATTPFPAPKPSTLSSAPHRD